MKCLLYRGFLFPLVYCYALGLETRIKTMGHFLRNRRHLLFPDPEESETKVQVLFGLGLPMEDEIAMTLGYVLKCNYNLPYNISQFAGTMTSSNKSNDFMPSEKSEKRTRRHKNQRLDKSASSASRWTLYRILEAAMEILGSGKACLLRAVCEHAATPFERGHGLLGELLHVILTPSTTLEEYEIYSDREYSAAEEAGKNLLAPNPCRSFYPECERNPMDYFTVVIDA